MFDKDIVKIIQEAVDKINNDHWNTDECKPIFIVSILYNKKSQSILLTCQHMGESFSRIIFPKEDCYEGYDSLFKEMRNLYNQTM